MNTSFETAQAEKMGQINETLARMDERLKRLEDTILRLQDTIASLNTSLSGSYRDQVVSCQQKFITRIEFETLKLEVERKASKTEFSIIRLLVFGATGAVLLFIINKLLMGAM